MELMNESSAASPGGVLGQGFLEEVINPVVPPQLDECVLQRRYSDQNRQRGVVKR